MNYENQDNGPARKARGKSKASKAKDTLRSSPDMVKERQAQTNKASRIPSESNDKLCAKKVKNSS